MSIETEPKVKMVVNVKKDKVKVRKSNPLKGAIIDVDYNTELTEVFGEEPVDLFSDEFAIIDDENKEVWDNIRLDLEYNQKKANLLKDLEKLEQENALRKNANKYKSHIIDMLKEDIKCNEDAIKKHQDENLRFQQHLNELESITDDNNIMDYLANSFADEVNELINEDTPKPVKSKKQKGCIIDDGKEKPERKPNTKKEEWDNIPEGTEFKMLYNKSGLIYMKSKGKLVRNDTGVEYSGFHQAVTQYALEVKGKKVSLKGWESFERVE